MDGPAACQAAVPRLPPILESRAESRARAPNGPSSRLRDSDTLRGMSAEAEPLDKRRTAIQEMFSAVAPRYDLLNRLLSAGRDVGWRRTAAAALELAPGSRALDLCCGTGDQALALLRHTGKVLAIDFSMAMLGLARRKFRRPSATGAFGVAGDALRLPLPAARFAGVTVSFGLRNVEDLQAALEEISRVLEPGGRVAVLEFAIPRSVLLRSVYLLYFQHLLPRIGHLLSPRGSAYRYLSLSVQSFPQRGLFTSEMSQAGFTSTSWRDLSGGIVCLYTGARS